MLYIPLLCFVIIYICEKMYFQVHLNIYTVIILHLHVCGKKPYVLKYVWLERWFSFWWVLQGDVPASGAQGDNDKLADAIIRITMW